MIFVQTVRKTLGDLTERKHQLSKMTLNTFQKCLFELCSAFFLVVNRKTLLRNSWDLSTRNNTCSLFKCRVTFRLRYFSNAMFGTLALYLLRLRCLAIPNTWKKNSFWFFRKRGLRRFGLCAIVLMIFVQTVRKILGDLTERKTPTLQNDVEYVPKISVRALLCFFLWL